MKTAEEILFTYSSENEKGIMFHSRDILKAMQEYADQFKQPASPSLGLDDALDVAIKALEKIASKRHFDRSCTLEAQGYNELECAVIGEADSISRIAIEALQIIHEAHKLTEK